VHDRALAAVQERAREAIEGALAALLFTAVALQSGLVVVGAPRTNVVALTAGTLEGPIFPAQRMDGGLTRFGVEEGFCRKIRFLGKIQKSGIRNSMTYRLSTFR